MHPEDSTDQTWLGGLTAEDARHEMPWWEWPDDLAKAIERMELEAIGTECCVYMVGDPRSRRVKIGMAKRAANRISAHRGSSPVPLRVVAIRPGASHLEKALHAHLDQYRLHGEWFTGTPYVTDYFSACPDAPTAPILHEVRKDAEKRGKWRVYDTRGRRFLPGVHGTEDDAYDAAITQDIAAGIEAPFDF